MSGHSHWAGIKHKKAVVDAKRAQVFTKLGRAISVAAREGGGNPDFNPNLRLAIEKARELNMTKDKIEKAIRRGMGLEEGKLLEEIIYEALGPSGTMLIIITITDNRNRAISEIRRIIEKHGGKMADGGIGWNFKRLGIINLSPNDNQYEDAMNTAIENDAEDVIENGNGKLTAYSSLENFNDLKTLLAPFNITESGIGYIPQNAITLEGRDKEKFEKLIEELEDHQDVQEIFDNLNI